MCAFNRLFFFWPAYFLKTLRVVPNPGGGKYFLGLLIFSFRTNAKNKIKPGGKDASFRTKLRKKKKKLK